MTGLWAAVIAVLGTLSGALVAGGLQARSASTARRETQAVAHRTEALAAVTALVTALADHRRAMWVREDLRLSGASAVRVDAARATSHDTRSAITAPLVTVSILLPNLAHLAQRATSATYALRHAPDPSALADRREAAITAADRLVNAAARTLATFDMSGDPA